jgi:hypothetical protein
MPLRLPNLDDRRYIDLVAEALERIPTHSPQWTNYNPSDPGITLVELFAYLADMLLYRINRVTDDNTRKFLKLLNDPDWETGDLRSEIRKAVLGIRERYRAVTKDDYEFLSTESFNSWLIETKSSVNLVARAHCVPQRNLEAGTEPDRLKLRPEHVSVVIIPRAQPNPSPPPPAIAASIGSSAAPQPSQDQMSALLTFLEERRMLTAKLHVVGPFYARVSAQLLIARNADAPEEDLIKAVKASLAGLLNPLPSSSSTGWPFGRDVFVSDIYGTLEKIPGLDFIVDVMLESHLTADDDKCVVVDPIWHADGDLVGLAVEEHHLPVFDSADIVTAVNAAFVIVNLSVSVQSPTGADPDALKRIKKCIKTAVRGIFHPSLGGPGPTTAQPTDILLSNVQGAIQTAAGPTNPVSVVADCIPSSILRTDHGGQLYIHVEAGKVVDWRTVIRLIFN